MMSIQSPYSGEALVLEVDRPFIYNNRNDTRSYVSNLEIGLWLNSHGELRKVDVKDLDELKMSLNLYFGCRTSLQLALYSVDSDLDSSLQQQSIELLEPLLENQKIFNWLLDLFCIQELPVPSTEILKSSLEYAEQESFQNYISFYKYLLSKQSAIKSLANLWKQVEESLVLGNNHQDLMDEILGTGLFKQVIDSNGLPILSELILIIVIKVRASFDLSFILNVIPKSIEFERFCNFIGFIETTAGIDNLCLWSLVDILPEIDFDKSTQSEKTPFELCDCNNSNLIVFNKASIDEAIIPLECLPNLLEYIESSTNEIISPHVELPPHDPNAASTYARVTEWVNRPLVGACQFACQNSQGEVYQ